MMGENTSEKGKAGGFLLEILTKGMYENPLYIYREYIQNSCDSIDDAVAIGLIERENSKINITINTEKREIVIRDNGTGISQKEAAEILLDIGASKKDGISRRGFRGIGRLGGLAYAESVEFITSAYGEPLKTIQKCDCQQMHLLISKGHASEDDIMDIFRKINSFSTKTEQAEAHYFEIRMHNVDSETALLNETAVSEFLQENAPVDFNSMRFNYSRKIKEYFKSNNAEILTYNIIFGKRRTPIYKPYSLKVNTGRTNQQKNSDMVYDIEFFEENDANGNPLYKGWIAITDFSGSISDNKISGIRFRVGNILVGNHNTFNEFFPTSTNEGARANRLFMGEIHILTNEMIPNSQRDNFEKNATYYYVNGKLREWAGTLNKKYRRGTSVANSAIRKLQELDTLQNDIRHQLEKGITSNARRETLLKEINKIESDRLKNEKIVTKAIDNGIISDEDKREKAKGVLTNSETNADRLKKVREKVENSNIGTPGDLPSSYSRTEKKIYQRIVAVIDKFFENDQETADSLRTAIIEELKIKKK